MDHQNLTSLEQVVVEAETKGKEWVSAKQVAKRLEELKKYKLSKVMNEFEISEKVNGGKVSETKLKRLAEGSKDYKDHVEEWVIADKEANKLRIEYDALINFYEAKRSMLSLEKAKVNAGI